MTAQRPLVSGFLASAEAYADCPAIQIKEATQTYAELRTQALRIAATLQRAPDKVVRTGVYGHRSFAALSGVLAGLLCGGPYVPLNPSFPMERNLAMTKRAGLRKLVVESDSVEAALAMLSDLSDPLYVVVPDLDELPELPDSVSQHIFVPGSALAAETEFEPVDTDPEQLAYLLFTSGSTGQPKGVMVKQSNVNHFVDCMVDRYGITNKDRFSQTFDLTFDLSAFDMFVAWQAGACLCVPTQGEKMLPAKYIQSQNISIWFSVPSTAIMMKKLRMLKEGAFPSIRYSLFCGEALPLEVTEAFQQAAPNSVVENLYGPTELTIACTLYRYDSKSTAKEAKQGVVPIGHPYPEMEAIVVDEELMPVLEGEAGELLMTGPQLTLGYLEGEEKTKKAFVIPPGESRTFYRTGDRVVRDHPDGPLLYVGRVDNQIKVQGYRVELGEIEAKIRAAAGADVAIAAGYPVGPQGAESVIAFVSQSDKDESDVRAELANSLPSYMQPRELIPVAEFPLNANGKVDRKALMTQYLAESD